MVDSFAALFNYTPVDRASDSMMAPDIKLFILVGWGPELSSVARSTGGSTDVLLLLQISGGVI